jgi:hypothetical protein
MKPSRRFALAFAAIAVAVVGIVLAALSLPSSDDEPADDGVVATPEPTATATTAAASPFAGFALNAVAGTFEPVASVDEIPADHIGAYFMDTSTGEVTGWYANLDGPVTVHGISGDNRFVAFGYRTNRRNPARRIPGPTRWWIANQGLPTSGTAKPSLCCPKPA